MMDPFFKIISYLVEFWYQGKFKTKMLGPEGCASGRAFALLLANNLE